MIHVIVLHQAKRELSKIPKNVSLDIYALFDELGEGKKLSMPISKPLSNIAKGLHELRLSYRDGIYRVFYIIISSKGIYILYALKKKTQKLDKRTKQLIISRIRSIEL